MIENKKSKKFGIFLMHGITKSKEELSLVKESLEELGYYVETPNLPKHGICPREFETCWRDTLELTKEELLTGVEEKFIEFRKKVGDIIIVGNSLGANLAFYLANKYTVKGIIAISPVYQLTRGIDLLLSIQPKIKFLLLGKSDQDVYHNFNLNNVIEIINISKESRKYIQGISIPTLLIFSKESDLTSSGNADFFIKWLRGYAQVHWAIKEGHGIPKNPDILPIIKDFCANVQENL